MCQFITAILPNDAVTAELAAVFRRHGRECRAYVNASLAVQIGSAQSSYYTTLGHCDCGTQLGSTAVDLVEDGSDSGGDRVAREVEASRLRRKGWSESKILRALSQRDEAKARPRASRRDEQTQTSLGKWCALIREALVSPHTAYVGLLLHGYSGNINNEEIILQARQTISVGELSESTLASMRGDTIYEFRR